MEFWEEAEPIHETPKFIENPTPNNSAPPINLVGKKRVGGPLVEANVVAYY